MTDTDNRGATAAAAALAQIVEWFKTMDVAGECDDHQTFERVCDEAREYPLSVQVRDGWRTPGEEGEPEEYELLLCTGGPAVRVAGMLGSGNEPSNAEIHHQDWFTSWEELQGVSEEEDVALLWFAGLFYYGEG